jgi:hypothetical protein
MWRQQCQGELGGGGVGGQPGVICLQSLAVWYC